MPSEMQDTLAKQRRAFQAELPVSAATRKGRIERLIALMRENADRFADALSEDYGHRSRKQSLAADVASAIGPAKHALKHLDKWMKPESRKLPLPLRVMGAKARIEWQPKGVVGVISPWNFPVQLSFAPIAGVFAAGNRCMLKPSEVTPTTSAAIEELVPKYFASEELAVCTGGPEVGKAFAELPFDHLVFTGATSVARHILRAAADNLVPVTLELGGKSPAIMGKGADLDAAARRIVMAKMMNAGQICIAPDYILVEESRQNEMVAALRTNVAAMYPTLLENPDFTSIINERHRVRLASYLEDAREKGATLVEINPADEDFSISNSLKMPLTLVLDPTEDMAIMQEEIFGPILPVRRYSGIGEAIDWVNAKDRPLALYHFGSDEVERREILDRTVSGGVTLDGTLFHAGMEELPFGGIGPSGMGAYHGFDGFRSFSHGRAVFKEGWADLAKLGGMIPPYGKATDASIRRSLDS